MLANNLKDRYEALTTEGNKILSSYIVLMKLPKTIQEQYVPEVYKLIHDFHSELYQFRLDLDEYIKQESNVYDMELHKLHKMLTTTVTSRNI